MSDPLALHEAIGTAYGLHLSDRHAAVAHLRQFCADDERRQLALARRDSLAAIVKARSLGDRCGCWVSKATHDLLNEALNA